MYFLLADKLLQLLSLWQPHFKLLKLNRRNVEVWSILWLVVEMVIKITVGREYFGNFHLNTTKKREREVKQDSVPDPNPEMLIFSGSRSNVNLTAFPRSSSYLRSLTKCCGKKGQAVILIISTAPICFSWTINPIHTYSTLTQSTGVKHCEKQRQTWSNCSSGSTLMSARSSLNCSSDMDADLSVSRLSSSALFCLASNITTATHKYVLFTKTWNWF